MPNIRCPRCQTAFEKPAMGAPVCPNCGYGAPALAPAPGPAPSWSQPPAYAVTAGGGKPKASSKAVTAMVLGIVGCCIWIVPLAGPFLMLACGILALVLGIMGLKEAGRAPGQVGGKGMAITGIVLGAIVIALGILGVVAAIVGLAFIDELCEDQPDNPACEDYQSNAVPGLLAASVAGQPAAISLAPAPGPASTHAT